MEISEQYEGHDRAERPDRNPESRQFAAPERIDERNAQQAGEQHDENLESSYFLGVDRLAQSYPGIGGVERVLDWFGIRKSKQPGNSDGSLVHPGDIRQGRRGEQISRFGLEYEAELHRFADALSETHPRNFVIPDQSSVQLSEWTLFADQDFAWCNDPDDVALKQGCAQQEASEYRRKESGDAKPMTVRQVTKARQGNQTQK
ncbi:hypothetical protein [Bradyrhizobium sp. RDI18]|uniref:hypothetical protein n=1 Tax=Bradyrhizobium sp. RDI18 TaxID=3367400 RepID=UPI003719F2ED